MFVYHNFNNAISFRTIPFNAKIFNEHLFHKSEYGLACELPGLFLIFLKKASNVTNLSKLGGRQSTQIS